LWHPEAAPTAALRRDIDRRSRRLKDVLSDEAIRKDFLKGVPKNDAKVVKAFVAANASNALKTRPKVSYSILSLLFQRVHHHLSCLWPPLSCKLVVLHGCIASGANFVSSTGKVQCTTTVEGCVRCEAQP